MDNSAIIADVGRSLARVLELSLKARKRKANVILGPPRTEIFQKSLPAFGLSLLGIDAMSEKGQEPEAELLQEQDPDGTVREYFIDPPLPLQLEFLLTAWTKSYEEDAALLGFGMKAMLEVPTLEPEQIVGESFTANDQVVIRPMAKVPMETRLGIFQGFGEPPRGGALYKVAVLLYSERRSKEVRRVLSRHVGYVDGGTGRRYR